MGFRFRKSVTLFPGVRVNLSGGGISTTIGGRGASVNIGRRGAYLNVGVPGSGVSFRTRLDRTSPTPVPSLRDNPPDLPGTVPVPVAGPSNLVLMPGEGEIRSAAVSALTSDGLGNLKRLINDAADRQRNATFNVDQAVRQLAAAKSRLATARTLILRLALWFSIPARQGAVAACEAEVLKHRNELATSHINIDFAFDHGAHASFEALRDAHRRLRACGAIWDITSSHYTNQAVERTSARTSLDRTPVRLSESTSPIIDSMWSALRFENANGEDLLFYPGFVLMASGHGNFALIDLREVSVEFDITNFHEEERVPRDCEVIGQTWKKTNKDGSPDRRFNGNYRIPVVRYGRLIIRSRTGINENYMFSNPQAALEFARAFTDFKQALHRTSPSVTDDDAEPANPGQPDRDAEADTETPTDGPAADGDAHPPRTDGRPPAHHLLADAAVLVALAALIAYAAPFPDLSPALTPLATEEARGNGPAPEIGSVVVVRPNAAHGRPHANVRSQPDPASVTVAWPSHGTRLVVFERNGGWLKVSEAMGKEAIGWVHAADVDATGDKATFAPATSDPGLSQRPQDDRTSPPPSGSPVEQTGRDTFIVKAQVANIRAQPTGSSAIIGKASAGARYSVFGKDGDWLHVGDREPVGWMHKSLIGISP